MSTTHSSIDGVFPPGAGPSDLDWRGNRHPDFEAVSREMGRRVVTPIRRHARICNLVVNFPSLADDTRAYLLANLPAVTVWEIIEPLLKSHVAQSLIETYTKLMQEAKPPRHKRLEHVVWDRLETQRRQTNATYMPRAARSRQLWALFEPREGFDHRLRAECFPYNLNLTLFDDAHDAPPCADWHMSAQTKASFDHAFGELAELRAGDCGQLFAATDVVVMPLDVFAAWMSNADGGGPAPAALQTPAKPGAERSDPGLKAFLRRAAAHFRSVFAIADETRMNAPPMGDFTLSFVAGGRALLATNLRPPDDADQPPTLRLCLIDCSLESDEERGRLVHALVEAATFRAVAMRDYGVINLIDDALGAMGHVLTDAYNDYLSRAMAVGLPPAAHLDKLENALHRTALLNALVQKGISTRALEAEMAGGKVDERLAELKENAVDGFETLDEHHMRFRASVSKVVRTAARYSALRERATQILSLMRTEFDQAQMVSAQAFAARNLKLAYAVDLLTKFIVVMYFGTAMANIFGFKEIASIIAAELGFAADDKLVPVVIQGGLYVLAYLAGFLGLKVIIAGVRRLTGSGKEPDA